MTALVAAILAGLLGAGDPGAFRAQDLGARGRIDHRVYADLDGDGRRELLLITGKRVSVYRSNPHGSFRPASPRRSDLPANALTFATGQVDENARSIDLVLVTPDGVVLIDFDAEYRVTGTRLLVPAKSLIIASETERLYRRDFLKDLDGDGLEDVVLATSHGFAVFYQRRHGKGAAHPEGNPGLWPEAPDRLLPYTLLASVDSGPSELGRGVTGAVGVPALHPLDLDGDGRIELGVEDGRALRIFAPGEDGLLSQEPAAIVDLGPILGDGRPGLEICELDGDGRPDFVVTRKRRGVTEIHLSSRKRAGAAQTIELAGWSFPPSVLDLDGDGNPDLIVPTTPEIGFTAAIALTLSDSVAAKYHVFLGTGSPKGPFPAKADRIFEVSVKRRLHVDVYGHTRATISVLFDASGDFDGDGRKDLLLGVAPDEVKIFPGTEEGVFGDTPVREIEIPGPEEYTRVTSELSDLNGDGRLDAALFYESRDRRKDRVVLVLSTD